jgi:hypothetical protein
MFFYVSLGIASLFAALVILWLYHAVADASGAVLKSMLPGKKTGPTSHLTAQRKRPSYGKTPTPWGWDSHDKPAPLSRKRRTANHAAVQYTKPKPATTARHGTGWVEREERSELGGKAYKVTRKNVATAEGFKSADRPWGW